MSLSGSRRLPKETLDTVKFSPNSPSLIHLSGTDLHTRLSRNARYPPTRKRMLNEQYQPQGLKIGSIRHKKVGTGTKIVTPRKRSVFGKPEGKLAQLSNHFFGFSSGHQLSIRIPTCGGVLLT